VEKPKYEKDSEDKGGPTNPIRMLLILNK